jgi:hypothetical protein
MWRVGALVFLSSLLLILVLIGSLLDVVSRFGTRVVLSSSLLLTGCGPLERPMPIRLPDETQKQVDEAWHNALTPINRLDHQQWLDAFVLTYAFQGGVDRLSFRSEKEFSGGLVVMEIHFDVKTPDQDRFEVSVLDHTGKRLRHESYTRAEVEETARFFHEQLTAKNPNQPEPPEQIRKRHERAEREKVIADLVPMPKANP